VEEKKKVDHLCRKVALGSKFKAAEIASQPPFRVIYLIHRLGLGLWRLSIAKLDIYFSWLKREYFVAG
jgi:hypothetical protein